MMIRIVPSPSYYLIAYRIALEVSIFLISRSRRFVSLKQLAAWWILEEIFDEICLFLETSFGTHYD